MIINIAFVYPAGYCIDSAWTNSKNKTKTTDIEFSNWYGEESYKLHFNQIIQLYTAIYFSQSLREFLNQEPIEH